MGLQRFYGAYSLSHAQQRQVFDIKDKNPGPGAYNISTDITKTYKKSFPKDAKLQLKVNGVPPTGTYQVNTKQVLKSCHQFSMGKKIKSPEPWNKLGPGAYDIRQENNNNLKKSFGYQFVRQEKYGQKKVQTAKETSPIEKQCIQKQKQFKSNFSKHKRNLEQKDNGVPGPGSYAFDQKHKFYQTSYSFGRGTRRDGNMQELQKVPGPGKYSTTDDIQSESQTSRCTFGHKQKDYELMYRKDFPPPNAYYPEQIKSQQQIGIQQGPRSDIILKNGTPGPGLYSNTQDGNKIAYSIRFKQGESKIDQNPGPGTYEIKSKAIEGTSASFKKKLQSCFNVKKKCPGPGQYSPQKYSTSRQFKFSKSNHLNCQDVITKNEVGPGNYEMRKTDQGPFYTFRQKPQESSKYIDQGFTYEITGNIGFIPNYQNKYQQKQQTQLCTDF